MPGARPVQLEAIVGSEKFESSQILLECTLEKRLDEELPGRERAEALVVATLEEVIDAGILEAVLKRDGPTSDPEKGKAKNAAPSRPVGERRVERLGFGARAHRGSLATFPARRLERPALVEKFRKVIHTVSNVEFNAAFVSEPTAPARKITADLPFEGSLVLLPRPVDRNIRRSFPLSFEESVVGLPRLISELRDACA